MSELALLDFCHNFLIELRPRIQSVNVFVNLKRALRDPKISLSSDGISIIDDLIYKIPCKKLNFVEGSLNSVDITREHLSFRFSTMNEAFSGGFKSEILHTDNNNDHLTCDFPFAKDTKLTIQCSNCLQTLCSKTFKRILPLPSEHSEQSDWFCHNHGTPSNGNLDPQDEDLFYSICYCHLNLKSSEAFRKSTTNLICRRCLAWIGIILNEGSHKIWFNTVQISDRSKVLKTSALNDLFLTIRDVLKDSLVNSARIVLKCQTNQMQVDYILLWVIEKKLNILTDDPIKDFRDVQVAKVLFKFYTGINELVRQWMKDIMVSNVDVSKVMMVDVLKQLYEANKMLPMKWNSSNDFYISYLPLYDDK